MKKIMKEIEQEQLKKESPKFKVGDTVRVAVKVREGDKVRSQAFEGLVIKKQGAGVRRSFSVRRISFGEGVERSFPLHSPTVQKVDLVRAGKVRRAKLYYLKRSSGKKSRVAEMKKKEIAE